MSESLTASPPQRATSPPWETSVWTAKEGCVRPAQRVPWYAWLLIGALPAVVVVGFLIRNDTLVLGALALVPLVAPLSLFYAMRTVERDHHDGRTD